MYHETRDPQLLTRDSELSRCSAIRVPGVPWQELRETRRASEVVGYIWRSEKPRHRFMAFLWQSDMQFPPPQKPRPEWAIIVAHHVLKRAGLPWKSSQIDHFGSAKDIWSLNDRIPLHSLLQKKPSERGVNRDDDAPSPESVPRASCHLSISHIRPPDLPMRNFLRTAECQVKSRHIITHPSWFLFDSIWP